MTELPNSPNLRNSEGKKGKAGERRTGNVKGRAELILRQAQDDGGGKTAMELPRQARSQTPAEGTKFGNEKKRGNMKRGKTELRNLRNSEKGGKGRKLSPKNFVNSVIPSKISPLQLVAKRLSEKERENKPPRIDSFTDFLMHHARVKSGAGLRSLSFRGTRGAAADRRAARPDSRLGRDRRFAGDLRRRAVRQDGADAESAGLSGRGAVSQRRLLSAGRRSRFGVWSTASCGPMCSTRFRGWRG